MTRSIKYHLPYLPPSKLLHRNWGCVVPTQQARKKKGETERDTERDGVGTDSAINQMEEN